MLAGVADYRSVCAAAAAGFGPLGPGELARGSDGTPILARRWAERKRTATAATLGRGPGRALELATSSAAHGLERREGDGLKALHLFLGAALSEWRADAEPARLALALRHLGPAFCTLSGVGEHGRNGARRLRAGDAAEYWGGVRALLHTRFATAAPPGLAAVLTLLSARALGWYPQERSTAGPAGEDRFPVVNVCVGAGGSLSSSQIFDGFVLHGEVSRGYDGAAYGAENCRVSILRHTDVDFGGRVRIEVRDSESLQEALALDEQAALVVLKQLQGAGCTVVVTAWTPPAVVGQQAAMLGILLLHSVPEAEVCNLGLSLGVDALGFSALACCKPGHVSKELKLQRLLCGKKVLHHFLLDPHRTCGQKLRPVRTMLLISPTSQQCQQLKSIVLGGIEAIRRALRASHFSYLDISPGAGAVEISVSRSIEYWVESLQTGMAGSKESDTLYLHSKRTSIPCALTVRVLRVFQAGLLAGPRALLKSAAPRAVSTPFLSCSSLSSLNEVNGLVITSACDPDLCDVLCSSTPECSERIGGLEVSDPMAHGVVECSRFKRAWLESAVEILTQLVRVDGCVFSSVRLRTRKEDGIPDSGGED